MSHTKHHHDHAKEKQASGDLPGPYWQRVHHDWKFWIAISLMLTAMLIYVTTLDLSVQPTDGPRPQIQQPLP